MNIRAVPPLLLLASAGALAQSPDPVKARGASSCVTCHAQLDDRLAAPAKAWQTDAHAAAGLGCEACHGGDPSPAFAEDTESAMAPSKGFRPAPDRFHVAEFCGRCHADAEFMKRFNPQARVDQLPEYRTSVHGKRNARGDKAPATCTDCHGAHGVRPVSSPDSPVYAANVPQTCARCHADSVLMAPYGIRTDQYDEYRRSVHAAALLDAGDRAAPACNDCHGNHGAAPPGVKSVAHVCGQCHGREASLFGASFKQDLFDTLGVAECTVCHDHHSVRHPTPSLFHGGSTPRVTGKGHVTGTDPFSADLGDLEPGGKAEAAWQVVLRLHLRGQDERFVHRVEIAADGEKPIVLDATVRPGESLPPPEGMQAASDALSVRLHIEPLSGLPVEAGDALQVRLELQAGRRGAVRGLKVRDLPGKALDPVLGSACLRCHTPGDKCDAATERMYEALLSLDREIRHASTLLRQAELKGMEVSGPQFELKSKGQTAAVEARALIHTFDPERLVQRSEEGRKVAANGLEAANAALAELEYRRKGLAVSLALVALVLLGLYLKIRQVDRERRETAVNGG